MIDLLSERAVLEKLETPVGRQDLVAYGTSSQGHAHLAQLRALSPNTFVKSLLERILYDAASNAITSDVELLFHSNLLPADEHPVKVSPRNTYEDLNVGETLEFIDNLLKRYGVNKTDREWIMSDLTDNFQNSIKSMVAYGSNRTASDWQSMQTLWDAFDTQTTSNNEHKIAAKMNKCFAELLEYFYSTRDVCKRFVDATINRVDHDWSDFVANGPARAGILSLVAGKKAISDYSWAVIEERSNDSIVDTLLMAVAHPSLTSREAACMALEDKVPFHLEKTELMAFAEVADLLPERVSQTILPAIQAQIEQSWNTDEIGAWRIELSKWSPASTERLGAPLYSSPPPRWWQRKR